MVRYRCTDYKTRYTYPIYYLKCILRTGALTQRKKNKVKKKHGKRATINNYKTFHLSN